MTEYSERKEKIFIFILFQLTNLLIRGLSEFYSYYFNLST
jgi:hypothetical protein